MAEQVFLVFFIPLVICLFSLENHGLRGQVKLDYFKKIKITRLRFMFGTIGGGGANEEGVIRPLFILQVFSWVIAICTLVFGVIMLSIGVQLKPILLIILGVHVGIVILAWSVLIVVSKIREKAYYKKRKQMANMQSLSENINKIIEGQLNSTFSEENKSLFIALKTEAEILDAELVKFNVLDNEQRKKQILTSCQKISELSKDLKDNLINQEINELKETCEQKIKFYYYNP